MPLKVHITHISFAAHFEKFQSVLDQDIVITTGTQGLDKFNFKILVDANPTVELIKASSKLEALIIPWAGVPQDLSKIMVDFPEISVHNLHYNDYNTAEFGLALLLAAAKQIIPLDQNLRRGDWSRRNQESQALLLRGKTLLILGYGHIGRALAGYGLCLGMKVMAIKKHLDQQKTSDLVAIYAAERLHEILPQTDVLIIALPLTVETEGLINEKELSLMPKGSILINVGRGPIVNQNALFLALKKGHLHSAGSDVWYNYPESKKSEYNTLPADQPFGDLVNFVFSPHRGGLVRDGEQQRAVALANLLNAALRDGKIPNQVDLNAGY